jgi:dienelactone hydrolase
VSAIHGFVEEPFSDVEPAFTLFRKGNGPGVILMHELPGLTSETVEFADWLVAHGFHVVMPLLFGAPLQSTTLGLLKAPALCIRREFNCLARGKPSPVTKALRALCEKVHRDCGGSGVGAIGMCFTGGFVLAMMVEPALLAPVAAQPSLPFFAADSVDVDADALQNAARRTDGLSLLALRFEQDWRCTASRFERLAAALDGPSPGANPRFQACVVPGKGHSTLTFDYAAARERGVDTRQIVLDHLATKLKRCQ